MKLEGNVWKFGDDVDTDQIIPARYLNSSDPAVLARYAMEDARAGFAGMLSPGDILVAGKNFGCGSSREHAPLCLKAAGVSCVIAVSFARIFYRNAINIGLPILECAPAAGALSEGDRIQVDLQTGQIRDLAGGGTFQAAAFPPFMQELIAAGGLMNYIQAKKTDR